MIFNSYEFIVFFTLVFILYWFVLDKTSKTQNSLLLIASLVFFGWTDWRFLIVLIFNILFNYFLAKKIYKENKEKIKIRILWIGIIINVGVLGYYKYFNFFYENFVDVFHVFGSDLTFSPLQIIIPLGISFFTFQTLGYILDVFYEEVEPYSDILLFSTYVTFFPKILSGPIERAQKFIPQIVNKRTFNYNMAVDGLRQILWGVFAKMVIAENCAEIVNPIFNNYQNESGNTLLIGASFYAIQLYADFSGYSNMAIGVSKLFGIDLMRNFATPFFSTNISDFWRKWHMSLTTWMMDYIFTPLSFTLRRFKKLGLIFSIILTFLIVGLWHGANWTFVVFGALHGIYFIPLVLTGSMNKSSIVAKDRFLPSLVEIIKMASLFYLITLTSIFFRSKQVSDAIEYIQIIFSKSLFSYPVAFINANVFSVIFLIFIYFTIEWFHRTKSHDFEISNKPVYVRWTLYIGLFVFLILFGKSSDTFIYFQF
ncbi:MBOAT family O-acyltransferase [Mariniflexile sp. AS56]|uniref:MBOAT family O-acyltransferase n=1 Tax=Mariniflexile sp. AS56 TaxID=3063957 RepID=UPI0026EF67EB|nr:MBOAT family O-acyltransferase [Mariniflexile sp. AS56]MDO7171362.1 MBOAT family O-acyltransferase [Mariniflexile sp. AS56]